MSNKNLKTTIEFALSSLFSTGIELTIYQIINYLLENKLPILHIIISTITARAIAEVIKFLLDKKLVFQSKDSSFINYIILASIKALSSTTLISTIYFLTKGNKTLIKIIVDLSLFYPGYLVAKVWVHHKNNN